VWGDEERSPWAVLELFTPLGARDSAGCTLHGEELDRFPDKMALSTPIFASSRLRFSWHAGFNHW
jgi:hypothetical protein